MHPTITLIILEITIKEIMQTKIQKWIEDALEYAHGTHDLLDILNGIREGQSQLWEGEK